MLAIGAAGPDKALAQTYPQTQAQAAAARRPTYEYRTGPDPTLMRSALWTIGVMYGTSVVVAFVSPRSADNYLFVPIAGPWLDLRHRNAADNGKYETFYKALLMADGVVQAFGAAQLAWSVVFGETRLVEVSRVEPTAFALHISPLVARDLLGVNTHGTF